MEAELKSISLLCLTAALAAGADADDIFETKVRPVLAANCYACHTDSRMGGLRLDSVEAVARGGKSGPPILARFDGAPANSRGNGWIPRRPLAGRAREGGGPAARLPALWRALGPLLAGRGSLLRRQAQFHAGRALSECLSLS